MVMIRGLWNVGVCDLHLSYYTARSLLAINTCVPLGDTFDRPTIIFVLQPITSRGTPLLFHSLTYGLTCHTSTANLQIDLQS